MKFNLQRYSENGQPKPILKPRTYIDWEAKAVFNPSVVYDAKAHIFRMLYRTFPKQVEEGVAKGFRPGSYLINQTSFIGYTESKDGIHFERRDVPFISPDQAFDKYGCEDPRITQIGDTFYITYTAIDAQIGDPNVEPNVRIALATTKDFKEIKKHGIIGPPKTSKAGALFPDPVNNGKIGFIMTISSDSTNSHVAVRYYDSLDEVIHQTDSSWQEFLKHSQETALLQTQWWLVRGPELGAAPIRTERGWLLVYSAESMSHTWIITAALADLEQPHKLKARLPGFILQPVEDYERNGIVPQVTFPSGAVVVGDQLYVYYGGADTVIGLATCKLQDLLDYLEQFKG